MIIILSFRRFTHLLFFEHPITQCLNRILAFVQSGYEHTSHLSCGQSAVLEKENPSNVTGQGSEKVSFTETNRPRAS